MDKVALAEGGGEAEEGVFSPLPPSLLNIRYLLTLPEGDGAMGEKLRQRKVGGGESVATARPAPNLI